MGPSLADRPYRTVRDLLHAHAGCPAVVMGGGPSLPEQLHACPLRQEAIYVSANDHGAKLAGADYIVALDKIEDRVRPFGVPLVSRRMWADYRLMSRVQADSGITAAWVARLLGCAPIYLAGMDCGGAYWHDPSARSGNGLHVADHLRRWREMTSAYPADYRPIGGPLAAVSWPVGHRGVVPQEQLERDLDALGGRRVRWLVSREYQRRAFQAGQVVELLTREAQKLKKERAVDYA